MRNVFELQQNFGSVPIESIEFDANSRDDIPAILKGLQPIWCDKEKQEALFTLLEAHFRQGTDLGVGTAGHEHVADSRPCRSQARPWLRLRPASGTVQRALVGAPDDGARRCMLRQNLLRAPDGRAQHRSSGSGASERC